MSTFHTTVLEPTTLDPKKRVRYTTGLVLGVDEFRQEHAYFAEHDRLHNRALHGYGTAHGLHVIRRDSANGPEIYVDRGLAIDPRGRQICVTSPQCANLNDWLQSHADDIRDLFESPPGEVELFVVLCYRECETDLVPIPSGPCRSAEDTQTASRLLDAFELKLTLESPPHTEDDLAGRFGELLRRVRVSDFEVGVSQDEFLDEVRSLADLASPPESGIASPIFLFADEACEILHAAFRVWITEVRPAISGHCAAPPPAEDCVLLACLHVDVEETEAGLRVADTTDETDAVEVDEDCRPLLLNTRLLQEWICLLQGIALPVGSPPAGGDGSLPISFGGSGPLLESNLTKILGASWLHDQASDGFLDVALSGGGTVPGIVVAFGREEVGDDGRVLIEDGSLDDNTFEVLVHQPEEFGFTSIRGLRPMRIVPVDVVVDGNGLIQSATEVAGPVASGAAFLVNEITLDRIGNQQFQVVLKGDYVQEEGGARTIDAAFRRSRLPGVVREETNLGIQGGRFESWFMRPVERININTATVEELRRLPQIGEERAMAIIQTREDRGGFTAIEDLLDVPGIGPARLEVLRPFIFVA